MVAAELMVKDIRVVRALDLTQTLRTLTKEAVAAELVALAQVLLMVVSGIAHLLEAIKLQAAPAAQQIS
jgi:hypothetical protein